MAGRKRRTLTAPARIVLCLLLAGISGYFLYHCALDVLTTFQLKEQIAEFNRKAFIYMNQAQVLAAIGEEYFSGIYACDFIGQ